MRPLYLLLISDRVVSPGVIGALRNLPRADIIRR